MQERPQYKVTPEQGWSQMQTLLDQSMPVIRRSRRWVVFWWTTAVAVVAIFSSFYLLKESAQTTIPQQVNTPPAAIATNEINPNQIEIPPVASSSSVNEIKSNHVISSGINSSTPVYKNKAEVYHRNKMTKSGTTVKTTAFKIDNGKSSDNPYEKKSIALTDKKSNLTNKVSEETIEIIPIKSDIKEDYVHPGKSISDDDFISAVHEAGTIRQKSAALEFLPFVDAFSYRYSEKDIEWIQPGHFSYKPGNQRFSPTLSIGSMTGSQHGLGINGAIGADYALNTGLSFSGSIGLSSYSPGALTNQKDNLAGYEPILNMDSNYSGLYIAGEKVNTSTDYNVINPFVKSIRQWEINTGVKYNMTQRFFMEAGMSFGFGITAKSEYPIVTFSTIASPTADANVRTTFNAYNIVRSNMTSIYGGLGYHVDRHFSVSLKWKQGFDHYLLNGQLSTFGATEKRSDYIRGLNLGLSFNL